MTQKGLFLRLRSKAWRDPESTVGQRKWIFALWVCIRGWGAERGVGQEGEMGLWGTEITAVQKSGR